LIVDVYRIVIMERDSLCVCVCVGVCISFVAVGNDLLIGSGECTFMKWRDTYTDT